MRLTPEELGGLPTDEEVAFYRDHGYYLTRRVFSDEEIDAAVAGSERFYAGEHDFQPPNGHELEGWTPADGHDVLRKNDYASLRNRELTAIVRKPLLGAIAARLAGAPVRLWHDQLLYKPISAPGISANVGWHTDRQYWMVCTSTNMLTAWVPFHDSFEDVGTIMMIDGSHTWPDNRYALDFWDGNLAGLAERIDTGGKPVVRVPMNVPRGHVSFHHCRTIHGSGPNRSDHPRRAIAVHIQDESNRYREFYGRSGSLFRHSNDTWTRSVDGRPDYTDPVICPQLWPV